MSHAMSHAIIPDMNRFKKYAYFMTPRVLPSWLLVVEVEGTSQGMRPRCESATENAALRAPSRRGRSRDADVSAACGASIHADISHHRERDDGR